MQDEPYDSVYDPDDALELYPTYLLWLTGKHLLPNVSATLSIYTTSILVVPFASDILVKGQFVHNFF